MCASKMIQKIREKNIFRTICTFIAHVLGMEAKLNCLRWIIQTSMLKVVLKKINKIISLSENHTNLHSNICQVYKLVKKISMVLGKSDHTLFTNGYVSSIFLITQYKLLSFYSSVKLLASYTPPIGTQYNIYLTIT